LAFHLRRFDTKLQTEPCRMLWSDKLRRCARFQYNDENLRTRLCILWIYLLFI